MDLEALMATLADEQKAVITGELSKRNSENKNLRARAKTLEALEQRLKEKLGVEEFDDDVLERIALPAKGVPNADEALKAMQKKLEAEMKRAQELEKEHGSLKSSVRIKDRNEQVSAALAKAGVRSEALSAALKIAAADASYDEEAGAWVFDGKPLADYTKAFVKDHAYLLANPAAPGAGKPNGSPSGDGKDFLTKEEYEAMSPEDQKRNYALARKSMAKWK